MASSFNLPDGLLGRFGVVKLWPELQVAEDEVIARLKNTAELMGMTCVVIDQMGCTVEMPHKQMTSDDLDFVIHLHFSTPKCYDIFSFVALWNPPKFYHDFGYRPMALNLLSHDDFLSCSSPGADAQLERLISYDSTRLSPEFTMYHSLSDPIYPPTTGDGKLFYAGINWERLGSGKSRHQALLDELDAAGVIRIYGPRIFQGVRVWAGYQCYQGSLPFDGRTAITEINRAGICLVLSSDAHKDSALMSSRLFEGLAAGAVIICDENAFAKQHFGDTLLYINTVESATDAAEQVLAHVKWVQQNPEAARALAGRAQDIFNEKYILNKSIAHIYDNFHARKTALELQYAPKADGVVADVIFLLPEYDAAALQRHLQSAKTQSYTHCRFILLVDEYDLRHYGPLIRDAIAQSGIQVSLQGTAFFVRTGAGKKSRTQRLGVAVTAILDDVPDNHLFCLVAPHESLFQPHVVNLAGALDRTPDAAFSYSELLVKSTSAKNETTALISADLDLLDPDGAKPGGLSRFMFRKSAVAKRIPLVVPFLDQRVASGLAFRLAGAATRRATTVLDTAAVKLPGDKLDEKARAAETAKMREELDVIRDLDPDAFDTETRIRRPPITEVIVREKMPDDLMPGSLYLDRLSVKNLRVLLVQLFFSLPVIGRIKESRRKRRISEDG